MGAQFSHEKFRAVLQRSGMSQLGLAKRTGKTQSMVSRAATGHATPRLATLADYAAMLGVEVHEFLDMDEVDLGAESYFEAKFRTLPDAELTALAEALTRRAAVRNAAARIPGGVR